MLRRSAHGRRRLSPTRRAVLLGQGPAFEWATWPPMEGSFELIYVRGQIWSGSRDEGIKGYIWQQNQGQIAPIKTGVALCALMERPRAATILDP